jgi:hypothetical protein
MTQRNLWKVAISHSNSGADKNSDLNNGGMVEAGHSNVQADRRNKLHLYSMAVTENHYS